MGSKLPEPYKLIRLDLECELDALLDRQTEIETALALLNRMAATTQPEDAE